MCVSACPYKKVYLNHATGLAEKCTFCFPRIEAGQPTVCAETCVGRLRYIGLVLYDADAVQAAASAPEEDLLQAMRDVVLDPFDPAVQAAARESGITEDWLDAARRSPVYALIATYGVALPLHPEYRTVPMVWYVPPLSPVLEAASALGGDDANPDDVFHAVTSLRIPMEYLASLFTAGDTDAVTGVLMRLAGMRGYMRSLTLTGERDTDLAAQVGMSPEQVEGLYRLLAVAKYADRYIVPPAHSEEGAQMAGWASGCSLDGPGGPGMGGGRPVAGQRGAPVSVRLRRRRTP